VDGRHRAVIIGVNQCSQENRVPILRFAEADATAMRDTLTDSVTGTFDPADVTLLIGRDATALAAKQALRATAMQSTADDTFLVYFAGKCPIGRKHEMPESRDFINARIQ